MIAAVISPNSEAQDAVARALEQTGLVESLWSLRSYPDPNRLHDLPLQDSAGCVVFLDFSDARAGVAIALEAQKLGGPHSAPPHVVAMMRARGAEAELAKLGIHHSVGMPPLQTEITGVFSELNRGSDDVTLEDAGGSGRIYAFLPGRPGAGATTVAVHTAAAVARLSGEPTLLLDFDFRLGMTSFMLKLPGPHSVIDALDDIDRLALRWDGLINRRGKLDVLGSAPQDFEEATHGEANLEQRTALLLTFARRRYKTVVVDLPGEMREYEMETLRRAIHCLLVCNSDIGVMHMAQRKAARLRGAVLDEKTSVVLNRAGGLGMISPRDVEAILGLPARFSVDNAYQEIAQATRDGETLEGRGGVTAQIENIARWIMPQAKPGAESQTEESGARRFLEFFTSGGTRAGVR